MDAPVVHNSLLDYLNSALLVAVLLGLIHTFVRIGSLQTKIETMWRSWLKEHDSSGKPKG